MLQDELQSNVGYWVHLCAHRFESLMNARLAAEGISYRQYQMLAQLALSGEASQVELAKHAGVEPSTIVAVVDRMERDGLIERRVSPEDRRKHCVAATAAAAPIWKRVQQCGAKVKECATEGFTDAERLQLHSLLQRMHANLEKHQGSNRS